MKPKPGKKPYKNKVIITLEDTNLDEGAIRLSVDFDADPDIAYGPQTPAEEVAALMVTFAKRRVLDEHQTGAVLLPEEWAEGYGGG